MVCSYRRRRADPVHRRIAGRVYNAFVQLVTGVRVRDVDSSVFVKREAYLDVAPDLVADSVSLAVELLIRLLARGYRVSEVEIEHFPRVAGKNRGLNWRDARRVPVHLFRMAWMTRRMQHMVATRRATA
jgi:hypothetical protein